MPESDLIARLEALEAQASPAPWHVAHYGDAVGLSATVVLKNPADGRLYEPLVDGWPALDVVAACLEQSIPIATPDDHRSDGNAALIVAMRNALPELLRLARGH